MMIIAPSTRIVTIVPPKVTIQTLHNKQKCSGKSRSLLRMPMDELLELGIKSKHRVIVPPIWLKLL